MDGGAGVYPMSYRGSMGAPEEDGQKEASVSRHFKSSTTVMIWHYCNSTKFRNELSQDNSAGGMEQEFRILGAQIGNETNSDGEKELY